MGGEREVGWFLVLQILLQPVFFLPILQIRLCPPPPKKNSCAVPDLENELTVAGDKDGEKE